MKKLLIPVLCLLTAINVFAQKYEKPLVQFTGIVHNADSTGVIIPYVSIVNVSYQGQSFVSNYKGYFSFVAHEQDTIHFSSVGYAASTIVIPADVINNSYTLKIALKPQIINLPVFHVFPWATTEEFRKDFLSMRIADDDLEIAKKNASEASLMALARTLPRDAYETNTFQDFHNSVMNSHSIVNPLFNPFSWATIIHEISEGDKSRSLDNSYNKNTSTYQSN